MSSSKGASSIFSFTVHVVILAIVAEYRWLCPCFVEWPILTQARQDPPALAKPWLHDQPWLYALASEDVHVQASQDGLQDQKTNSRVTKFKARLRHQGRPCLYYALFKRSSKWPFKSPGESVDGRTVGKIFVSNSEIAKGSSGTLVLKGTYEGRPVAVKRLVKCYHDHDVAAKEHQNLIASDSHPNVVRLYGKESDRDFVYLALELCTCNLNDLIQKPTLGDEHDMKVTLCSEEHILPEVRLWTTEGYPSPELSELMRDIVYGLVHLHESVKMVHRDLKPQNVLINHREGYLCAKLSDMGISKRLVADESSLGHRATGCGTSGWQAPEQLLNGRQTRAVDMFSLGCVLFYCITGGEHPFGYPHERDRNIVESEPDLSLVEHIPEAVDLLSHLLVWDAELRLKASEVLIHPMLWDSEKRLSFLCDASDWVERKGGGPDTLKPSVLKELKSIAPLVLGTKNWNEKIEPALVNDRKSNRNTKQYEYDSVRDLLRLIRNKSNHFVDLPQDIQETIGPKPEGYDAYFRSRFPKLLMEVHKVLLKHCGKEKEFNKYFEGVDEKKYFKGVDKKK